MKEEGSRGFRLGIRMGKIYDAGRRELAYGCRRSERAPQTIEPKRSAHGFLQGLGFTQLYLLGGKYVEQIGRGKPTDQ
jgi:hypothetical protein